MAWYEAGAGGIVNKFKHMKVDLTFPTSQKFEGVQPAATCEQDGICSNGSFTALPWARTASVAVFPSYDFKHLPNDLPLIIGHKATVTDCAFSPFNYCLLATTSEDTTCKFWNIPEEGLSENISESLGDLEGHTNKITGLAFHNIAENVLATFSFDKTIRVWDVVEQNCSLIYSDIPQNITSIKWSPGGNLLGVVTKSGGMHCYDPRMQEKALKGTAHTGPKSQKICWMDDQTFMTSGFNKQMAREFAMWDVRDLSEPQFQGNLGDQTGIGYIYYDLDHNLLTVAGKGEYNVDVYSVTKTDQPLNLLSQYKSSSMQKGFQMLDKSCVDVAKHEFNRGVRLSNNGIIEYISFRLPTKVNQFQKDLYPPFPSNEQSVSDYDTWANGEDKKPNMMQLEPKQKEEQQVEIKKAAFAQRLSQKVDIDIRNTEQVGSNVLPIPAFIQQDQQEIKSSNITLGYWDIRGSAAPIRYVLHYSKVKFTDLMYGSSAKAQKSGESWFDEKDNLGLPFPNLPYLIDGDYKLTESEAIMHYICLKFNPSLLGSNDKDKARIQMLESIIRDLRKQAYAPSYKQLNGLVSDFIPAKEPLFALVDYLELNSYDFFGGQKVCFVDFQFFEIVQWLDGPVFQGTLKQFNPKLKAYMNKMMNLDGFADVITDQSKCMEGPFNGNMAWIGGPEP